MSVSVATARASRWAASSAPRSRSVSTSPLNTIVVPSIRSSTLRTAPAVPSGSVFAHDLEPDPLPRHPLDERIERVGEVAGQQHRVGRSRARASAAAGARGTGGCRSEGATSGSCRSAGAAACPRRRRGSAPSSDDGLCVERRQHAGHDLGERLAPRTEHREPGGAPRDAVHRRVRADAPPGAASRRSGPARRARGRARPPRTPRARTPSASRSRRSPRAARRSRRARSASRAPRRGRASRSASRPDRRRRKPVARPRRAQDRRDEVLGPRAVQPRRPHHRPAAARSAATSRSPSSLERPYSDTGFTGSVSTYACSRARRRRSRSRSGRRARRRPRARCSAAPSALISRARAGSPSQPSTSVHAARIHDRVRARAARRPPRPRAASAMSSSACESGIASVAEHVGEVAAELPGAAGDQTRPRLHSCRARIGSHHHRFSRYHSTVAGARRSKIPARFPAERAEPRRVDRVAAVVVRAGRRPGVISECGLPSRSQSAFVSSTLVSSLPAGDVVDLADLALLEHGVDPGDVVLDVDPVAHVHSVAVQRDRLVLEQVGDEQRDDLLRVLDRGRTCSSRA